ncbi:MAG: F0F1 ATP synthase subunit delta [Propionibacteriaceae bacterium]|jgi:F-type H+-transporting ATPase subunit delta|nr:F0F1 ATP synthase subunit delta [Propionibacteriaceae bacterium]
MNASQAARLSQLDAAADEAQPTQALADELFAVAALLEAQPTLRNALSDPTAADAARGQLAESVFGGRVSAAALQVVAAATALRWGSGLDFAAGIERQGLRALIGAAQAAGKLDQVEDELFRFERVVAGDPSLQAALNDRAAGVERRRQVVADLLDKKADPVTVTLAARAVAGRHRTFALAVNEMLALAAAARNRAVARVTVAKPLTAEQAKRLAKSLSAQVGREVNLEVAVDPAVLGGVLVRVGDEIIDGTVAGRLASAKKQLEK